jgi:iron complex transport system permease protein
VKSAWVWGSAAGLTVAALAASLLIGRYPIAPSAVVAVLAAKVMPLAPNWPPAAEAVVWQLRLPRIGGALLIGGALAASGAAYQGVFRNPMASPDILGVSAGAGFGAGLAILFGFGPAAIQALAFGFGLLAATATAFVSLGRRGDGALTMILAGVFVGALFSALLSILKYLADPTNVLPAITFWMMGSLAYVGPRELSVAIAPILAGFALVWSLRHRLDVLTFGDDEARALGVNAPRVRFAVVAGATLMTAASVAVGGVIGLIGLVAPHAARPFAGPGHARLIPASAAAGGVFLLIVDDVVRVVSNGDLPIGILTSLIGAPMFLYLLSTIARRGWA